MKESNISERLNYIMKNRGLKQVEILEKCKPFCDKYGIRLARNDLSQYVSGKVEPKQDKLSILSLALDVSEAWLTGYNVPMERNNYEDPNILKREAILEDIEKILHVENYNLCCESYYDDYFIIKDSSGQTVAKFYDYELIAKYNLLKKTGNITAELIIKSDDNKGVTINVLGRVAAGIPIDAIEEVIDTEEISKEMSLKGNYFGLQIHGDSMEPRIYNGDTVIVRQQNYAENGDIVIALINGHDATCKRLMKYNGGISLLSLNPKYEPMVFTKSDIDTIPIKIIGKVVELRGKF